MLKIKFRLLDPLPNPDREPGCQFPPPLPVQMPALGGERFWAQGFSGLGFRAQGLGLRVKSGGMFYSQLF